MPKYVIERVIPEARKLSADELQFETISAEFVRVNSGVSLSPYKNAAAKLYRTQIKIEDAPESFPSIPRNFQENDFLKRIAAAVLKKERDKRRIHLCQRLASFDFRPNRPRIRIERP